jgi:hypothetical protein
MNKADLIEDVSRAVEMPRKNPKPSSIRSLTASCARLAAGTKSRFAALAVFERASASRAWAGIRRPHARGSTRKEDSLLQAE